MNTSFIRIVAVICVAMLSILNVNNALAGNYTWTGSANKDWNNSANWSPSGTPSSNDTVTIGTGSDTLLIAANTTINRLVISGRVVNLGGYQLEISQRASLNGGKIYNGTLKMRGTYAFFQGTNTNCTIDCIVNQIKLSGGTFDGTGTFEQNGTANGWGDGGCVFNGAVTMKKSGTASFRLGGVNPDTFNAKATFICTNSGNLEISHASQSVFRDSVFLNTTHSTAHISFCNSSILATLEQEAVIVTGSSGLTNGKITLKALQQTSNKSNILSGAGNLLVNVDSCQFTGEVNITAPSILIKNNIFNAATTLIKTTASTNSYSSGGNVFNASATIENQDATRAFRLANETGDTYNADVKFDTGTNNVQVGYKGNNYFAGNITINSTKVVFNASSGKMILKGANDQIFYGEAAYNIGKLEINKEAGTITLTRSMTIDSSITFIKGIINTDSTITLKAAVNCSGASNLSFVDGPVKKIGNTAFVFPVGASTGYFPLEMTTPSNISDSYLCRYVDRNHGESDSLDTSIGYLATCGYWQFYRLNGTSNVKVRLFWDSLGCGVYDTTNLTIANWNGTLWKDLGNDSISGNKLCGSIYSEISVLSFNKIVWAQVVPQAVIVADLGTNSRSIPEDFFGYNGSNTITSLDDGTPVQSWDEIYNKEWLNSTKGTLIRIPAGTLSNYADWKTGYPIIERDLPFNWFYDVNSYQLEMDRTGNEFANIRDNLNFLAARPILAWNMLTANYSYAAASVFRLNEVNLPCKYIELGNEFYLSREQYKQIFPSVKDYIIRAETWASDYKNLAIPHHSDEKLAIVGSIDDGAGQGRGRLWLDRALEALSPSSNIDAITLHDYIEEPTSTCSLTTISNGIQESFMSLPFKRGDELKSTALNSVAEYNLSGINDPLEVWITEFNLLDQDEKRIGTWLHGLFNASMALTYLETEDITKVISHTLLTDGRFGNIFESNTGFSELKCHGLNANHTPEIITREGEFTAVGTALNLVASGLKDATSATQILFPGAHLLVDENNLPTIYEGVYGWKFQKPNGQMAAIIMNVSGVYQAVDIFSNVFPGLSNSNFKATAIFANHNMYAIAGNPPTIPSTNLDELHFYNPWRIAPSFVSLRALPFSMILLEYQTPFVNAKLTDDEICTGSSTSLAVESDNLANLSPNCNGCTGITITPPVTTNSFRNTYSVIATLPGSYSIFPCSGCSSITLTVHADLQNLEITSSTHSINAQDEILFCPGDPDIQLTANCTSAYSGNALSWVWAPAVDSGLVNSTCGTTPFCNEIIVSPNRSTVYSVYVTDQHCWKSTSVKVILPIERLTLGDTLTVCQGTAVHLMADFSTDPAFSDLTFNWSIPGANNLSEINIASNQLLPGFNTVTLTAIATDPITNITCSATSSVVINILECCTPSAGNISINPQEVVTNEQHPSYYSHALDLAQACALQTTNYTVSYLPNNTAQNKQAASITCFGSAPPIMINGDFNVLSDIFEQGATNLLVDGMDLTIIGCKLEFGPDAELQVNGGRNLTLENCTLQACGTKMWQGILLDKRGGVNPPMLVLKDCIVKQAAQAVKITREAQYIITDNSFIDNYIDLAIFNWPVVVVNKNSSDYLITGNTFDRSNVSLLAPFSSSEKFSAIKLTDAERPRIGSVGANQNSISSSLYGVHLTNSGSEIYNNSFTNILQDPNDKFSGTALFLQNENLFWNRFLRVGKSQGGNTFTSCKFGIRGAGESDYLIHYNVFGENNGTSNSNAIEHTGINIEKVSYNEIEIGPENKFYDYNKGISGYDFGEDVSLNINGNKFYDADWGRNLSYHATAISLMNPIPVIFKSQALVEGNKIGNSTSPNHSRIGISIFQAGNVKVENNDIYFHYNITAYPFFRGIQVINSQNCHIIRNTTIRNSNYVQGLNSAVVGIQVHESLTPSVNCNEPENMGFGMHFIGNNGAVTMVDNLISTYDRGISLGIDANLPGFIGQVQGSSAPSTNGTGYMNTWVDQNSDRVEGFIGLPISWYHGGPPGFSNQDAPVNNGPQWQGIIPKPNANEANDCSKDDWYLNRMSGYAGLVFDSIRYEGAYGEQHHYGHRNSFYKFFAADTSRLEGTGSDTMYRHVYNQIGISNVGKYQQVIQKTSGRNYAEAYALLETIEDTNYYESQLKTVLSIYLNRIISDSVLNAQDTAILTEIAYQNYLIGGEAVYLARAILRLEIEDGPIGESRIKNPAPKKTTRFFTVHPNPATDWLELNYSNEDQVKHLVIYDISGRQIKMAGNTRTIKLIDLQPGLYFINICYTDGEELIQKFIKQ